jgi:Leucine-rich repeat (LRR) protein
VNLADNLIKKIENLNDMPNLQTLHLKRNRIGRNGMDDLNGIIEIPSL